MCWSTRYSRSLLPNRCIEFFSICFSFIWDLHVVHSSVIIPYSGRDRPSQGGKNIVLDDDLLTQFLDPPPGAAMLQKLFLQQRLRHHWFLRDGPSTDTLITNYNLSPKFVASRNVSSDCASKLRSPVLQKYSIRRVTSRLWCIGRPPNGSKICDALQ